MYAVRIMNNGVSETLMDTRIKELSLIQPVIKEDINKMPSFSFDLPVINPQYDLVEKLKSEIVVSDIATGEELFRGRCMDDVSDFVNTKSVSCEGNLAYLLDVQYPPYIHTGSPKEFLKDLLDYYNGRVTDKQKIYLGNVTVTDPNDYIRRESENYDNIYNIIQDKLVGLLGGWIRIRLEQGKNYLDYLADYEVADQVVRFGENILDLTKYAKAETVKTVVIPLGAKDKESGKYLDITSVNDGLNYVKDDDLVKSYGWIETVVNWDDVTLPENLLKKAKEYLLSCHNMELTIELSAVDAGLLGMNVKRIHPGMMVRVVSMPHHLDEMLLCVSKTTNLLEPSKDKIVLGNQIETFTESVNQEQKETNDKIASGDKVLADKIVQIDDEFKDALDNASGLYKTEVKQDDGSTVTYYHDKKNLKDSQIQMIFNAAGFGVSADGGESWYGMQVDGDMIANILNATGINAEWIRTGKAYSVNYKPEQSGMVIDFDHGFIERFFNGVATRLISGALMITDKDIQVSYGPMGMTIEETGKYSVEANANGFFIYDISASKYILEIRFDHSSKKLTDFAMNGKTGKSGRAEFSDGSYLEFEQGILVGGRTSGGASV